MADEITNTKERGTKVNLKMSLSRNYNTIGVELLEETIASDTMEQFKSEVDGAFSTMREIIEKQFAELQEAKK